MVQVKTTNLLKGDLGELYFEHHCQQLDHKFAYLTSEEIYRSFNSQGTLLFRHGWHRIEVKVPKELHEEVRMVCQPSNRKNARPSFVFDYLTFSLYCFDYDKDSDEWTQKPNRQYGVKAFNWVEVKSGKSTLSESQKRTRENVELPFWVFRVISPLPKNINVTVDKRDSRH